MLRQADLAEVLRRAVTPRARRDVLRAAALDAEGVERLLRDARDLRRRDPVAAARLARAALALARAARDRALALQATRLLGQAELLLGRPRRARRRLAVVRREGDADLRARVVPDLAQALALLGRADRALALLAEARGEEAEGGSPERLALLDATEGDLLRRLDRSGEALRRLNRARRTLARAGGAAAIVAAVDANRASALASLQRFDSADRLFRRTAARCRAAGQESSALRVEHRHAYLLFLRGRFQQALHRLRDLRERFLERGDEYHVALCDLDEAELHLRLNLHAQAAVRAERAARAFDRLGIPQDAARARFFEALATRRGASLPVTLDALLRAREAFRTQGCEGWEAICLHRLAECDHDAGNVPSAIRRAKEAERRLRALGFREAAGRASVLLARLDADAGRTERGILRLERLAEDLRGFAAPWLACEVHHHLGRLHAVLGRARPAVRHALRASRLLDRHRVAVPPDEFLASFLRDKQQVHEDAVFFLLWLGGRRARERAFEVAERAKSRPLLDLLRERRTVGRLPVQGGPRPAREPAAV